MFSIQSTTVSQCPAKVFSESKLLNAPDCLLIIPDDDDKEMAEDNKDDEKDNDGNNIGKLL